MRPRNTLVLAGLALALLAFVLLVERRATNTDERRQETVRLLPGFNAAAVRAVELTWSNVTARAEREPAGWRLTAPIAAPAPTAVVEGFLGAVVGLTARTRITARELATQPRGLAEFGLGPPQGRLVLQLETNQVELRLGSRAPIGDRMYLQLAGEEAVYAIDAAFAERLPRSPNDWRDPALLDLRGQAFDRLEVRAAGRGFEVERDETNQTWRLTKPMQARADNAGLDHLLQQLREWKAAGFVTDDPRADLEPYGLATPALELVLGRGTNDLVVVQFGNSPSNPAGAGLVHARRLSHTNVVLVPREPLDRLRAPFPEYRDRRLTGFDPAAVTAVEVRAEDFFTLRRVPNEGWRVTEPLNFPADPELVEEFLRSLSEIGIIEFVKDVVTDFASYGLQPPQRAYRAQTTLTNGGAATNLVLVEVAFGSNQVDRIYARRTDENSVYSVPYGSLLRLPAAFYELRHRRLWSFASSNVTTVTLRQEGRTRKLVRNDAREWTLDGGAAGPLNTFAVEETLHRLGTLRAEAWTARGQEKRAAYGLAEAGLRLTIAVAGADPPRAYEVEFGRTAPTRRPYAATQIDGETVIFEFPLALYQQVLSYLGQPAAAEPR